jgi:hypothetical protein
MELAIQRGNAVCDPAGGVCLDDRKVGFLPAVMRNILRSVFIMIF